MSAPSLEEAAGPAPARWSLRLMAALVAALGVVPVANLLTLSEPQRWWRGAVISWIAWAFLVGTIAWLLVRFAPAACERMRARARARLLEATPAQFMVFVGTLTVVLGVAFGWALFHFGGATIDELSEQWQAHLLASGHLTARAEPHPEFFSTMQTVTYEGRWFSHFPIGGPALQAIGQLLRVPWLINPLGAAVGAVAFYRFAAATGDEAQARVAALLFALSPFVFIIAASKLDHVGALAAVWLALAALPAWHRATTARDAARSAAIVGACLGIATTIRPYDGLLACIAVGGFQLATAGRSAIRWRALLAQAAAGAVPIGLLLLTNRAMTGHPLTFAYDVLNGAEHRPGFHLSPLGFAHTPRHGLYVISSYLMRLNPALLAWPVPVVGLAAAAMAFQRRVSRWDVLLVALLGTSLAGYFLYWGEGSFNGPRFLYVVAPVFLLYLARFPATIGERVRRPRLRGAVALLVPLWLAVAWLTPARRAGSYGVWTLAAHARQDDATPRLTDAVASAHATNAVVFVPDGWHARLTARLRALGAPPFLAQLVVGHYDACDIQQRLDSAEHASRAIPEQARAVFGLLETQPAATPVPGLSGMEQFAIAAGRDFPAACTAERERALARGMDMARLLPLMSVDSTGRLAGDVIYARDFGARNALLRDRFGDRNWFVAKPTVVGDSLVVTLEPWRP